jgi:hypothetical protein
MKTQLKIVALGIILTMLIPAVLIPSTLAETRFYGTTIVDLGSNDVATAYTTAKINIFIPQATLLFANDLSTLQSIARNTMNDLIIVGHGQKDGLLIGSTLVDWTTVKNILSGSPSSRLYLASCYSQAVQINGKSIVAFKEKTDVDEAAMKVTAMYYGQNNQTDRIPAIIKYFTAVLTDKVVHPTSTYRAFLDTPPPNWRQASAEGWVWALYAEPQGLPQVKYTSPDVFYEYPWCTVNTDGGAESSEGFAIGHITQNEMNTYSLTQILGYGAAYIAIAALIVSVVGAVIAAILGVFAAAEYWIITSYVQQPNGDGWLYANNIDVSGDYLFSFDFKLGGLMWFTAGVFFYMPYSYPLWYGGTDLGLDGI